MTSPLSADSEEFSSIKFQMKVYPKVKNWTRTGPIKNVWSLKLFRTLDNFLTIGRKMTHRVTTKFHLQYQTVSLVKPMANKKDGDGRL